MNVTCPECRSVFRVDPAKVPAGGVRARCAVCGGVMPVTAPAAFVGAPGDTPARSSVAMPGAGGWGGPAATHAASRTTPAMSPAASAGASGPARPTPDRGAAPDVASTPGVPAPAPSADRPPTPPRPATPAHAPPAPPMPRPSAPSWTPVGSPSAPPPAAPRMPTPAGAEVAGDQRPSGRPINPFLANDPNQKAKRLARALVSDIVAYHPQLRDQGMRDGTLKQLFRDEIKKSYEEYVDQVGKEFADSTPHFQDALNEVLAGGRRLF